MTAIKREGKEGKCDHDYILTMNREGKCVSVIMPELSVWDQPSLFSHRGHHSAILITGGLRTVMDGGGAH